MMYIGHDRILSQVDAHIEDLTLSTQRGQTKFEYDNRLFRLVNKNKPHIHLDGQLSFYFKCCNSSCNARLTARCIGSLDNVVEYVHNP